MAERRYPLREKKARKAFSSVYSSVTENDRLSSLPDDLLHQIFSRFYVKKVVQTSVLSKRWRYFWTTLSFLNFNSDYLTTSVKFDDHVSQVLDRRCKNSNINTLSIFPNEPCRKNNIQSWIRIAVHCNVQTLDLRFFEPDSKDISLPPSLFTCQSLKDLTLVLNMCVEGNSYRILLPLPDSINLPHLKKLTLCAISNLSTQSLDKLFSGCPLLENLVITNVTFDKSRSLVITSNILKKLVIDLWGGDCKCGITVHAPDLISFRCIDWCSNNYHLVNVASLETMYLDNGIHFGATVQDANNTVKWLKEISSVKSLTLVHCVFEVASQHLDILRRAPISFGKLRYLNVTIEIDEGHVQAAKCILENSPNLETLIINKISPEDAAEISDGWAEGLSLCNLKCVELHYVEGFDNELDLLKGLVKKATALEEMNIFEKKLIKLAQASTRVNISFHESEH